MRAIDFTALNIDNQLLPINEVAMNPTAYAQSIEQAQQQGVKIGFEFEVCVPSAVFTSKESKINTINHNLVDELLYDADTIVGMSLYQYSDSVDSDLSKFDSLFTPKPRKSKYPNLTTAFNTLLEKRVERAKELFYKIPEDVRAEYSAAAKNRLRRYNDVNDQRNPLMFVRILADLLMTNSRREANRPYKDVLEEMTQLSFHQLDVLREMFPETSVDRILSNMSKYFNYDPEKVYNEYDLVDHSYDEDDYEDYPGYSKASKAVATALRSTMNKKVVIFDEYHEDDKRLDRWYIEPDGSLSPNEQEDACVEIVGPPQKANKALDSLKRFFEMAQRLNLYTNRSTGLHINVSIPKNIDVLKLAVFTGDQYVLKQYERLENNYSRSVTRDLSGNYNMSPNSPNSKPFSQELTGSGKNVFGQKKFSKNIELEQIQDIADRISNSHTASISNENENYISFRHVGGDYLKDHQGIVNVVGRFVRAMIIASDPNAYRNEYLAAVAKLAAPAMASTGFDADILKIKQEGLSVITVYLYRSDRTTFKTLLSRAGYQASPNIIIGSIETNSEEAYNAMGAKTNNASLKSSFAQAPITKFAKVVIRPTNFTASEYYRQRVSGAVGYVGDGYYLEILDKLSPTDPYVQQVILQMRRDRFKNRKN